MKAALHRCMLNIDKSNPRAVTRSTSALIKAANEWGFYPSPEQACKCIDMADDKMRMVDALEVLWFVMSHS